MIRTAQAAAVMTAAALSGLAPAQNGPPGSGAPPGPGLILADATSGSGISMTMVCGAPVGKKLWLPELLGAGAAWLDADTDGTLDLFLIGGASFESPRPAPGRNRLYKGDGQGRFHDITSLAGVAGGGWGYGAAVGDYDGDGDDDLFVTQMGPDVLYKNNGNGTFSDVTARARVGDPGLGSSAAFFDADGDGDLDLLVLNYVDFDRGRVPARGSTGALGNPACTESGIPVACGPRGLPAPQNTFYRNNGDGTFRDDTAGAGFRLKPGRYALGVVTGDFDNDGDADVYIANDSSINSLWRNEGGRFTDVGVYTLAALSGEGTPQASMGTDFGDWNGDGWLDLVTTNFSQDLNTVYRNELGRRFEDVSFAAGMGETFMRLSWGVGWRDFDLDGIPDLFIANGHIYPEVDGRAIGTRFRQPSDLYLGNGSRFFRAPALGGLAVQESFRGAAFADYDRDGDVDVILTALDSEPVLLRNETRAGAGAPHFVQFVLPVGARVTLTAGGRKQMQEQTGGGSYLSASERLLTFGLGAATRVETCEIRWPGGARQPFSVDQVDRRYRPATPPRPPAPPAPG